MARESMKEMRQDIEFLKAHLYNVTNQVLILSGTSPRDPVRVDVPEPSMRSSPARPKRKASRSKKGF